MLARGLDTAQDAGQHLQVAVAQGDGEVAQAENQFEVGGGPLHEQLEQFGRLRDVPESDGHARGERREKDRAPLGPASHCFVDDGDGPERVAAVGANPRFGFGDLNVGVPAGALGGGHGVEKLPGVPSPTLLGDRVGLVAERDAEQSESVAPAQLVDREGGEPLGLDESPAALTQVAEQHRVHAHAVVGIHSPVLDVVGGVAHPTRADQFDKPSEAERRRREGVDLPDLPLDARAHEARGGGMGVRAHGAVRLVASGIEVWLAGSRPILSDVSLELRAGEVHALVGPNGAGKSTLFGVLSGDVAAEAGRVLLDDRPLAEYRPRELAQRRGVLLQHNAVAFSFTTEQVVHMGRAPWSGTSSEHDDDDAVAAALAATEVSAFADRPVSRLSGGERARVALARVLAQSVDVLLLDEPTAALDLKHHEDVMALARSLASEGATIAIVLHDLNAALTHAHRVTLLSRGRVEASGPPAEVLTAERIEHVYGQAVDVFPHPVTGVPFVAARQR